MALQKQPVAINFARGLDTKTDPFQIPIGSFRRLVNSVFNVTGRLTKRNGFDNITVLPDNSQTTLTTLNDNLIATGTNLFAFSQDTDEWLDQGKVQPVNLGVQSLVRVSTSQSSPDAAIAENGLTMLVYMDSGNSYYQVSDSVTGQQIVPRVQLPATSINPRAFLLGQYFIVTFMQTVTGQPHLRYIAIPKMTPHNPQPAADLSNSVGSLNSGYDGYVVAATNALFYAWEGATNTVKIGKLSTGLVNSTAITIPTSNSDLMSVTADLTDSKVYISYWDDTSDNGFSAAFNYSLVQVMDPTPIIVNTEIREITSAAEDGILTIYYENVNSYGFPGGVSSDFISTLTVIPPPTPGVGTPSATSVLIRSVGLASKPVIAPDGNIFLMVEYGDTNQVDPDNNSNQPTYFLIDDSGSIYMRLAYSNSGGYEASQVLPSITLLNDKYYVPYLITDFLAAVNKTTNSDLPANAIYTQKGISLAIFEISNSGQYSSEIAGALHLTGGQLWEYDGVRPVEHGFQVWPENIVVTTSATGGLITAQTYNYVFTYEWTDNAGMLHRSAPSIPVSIVTTGATSTNTIYVPTLRLTYKLVPNPVRIVGYRWSTAQQIYYQFTSLTSPTLNDTTIDYVTFIDVQSDSAILGNTLLYTTGGVIENIAAPASTASALFKNRLFLIDAEDPNLLWYSKQVIQNTPVEMSDLLTLFIAPTSGAQGSTGPMLALSAMDDKLIIFKRDAIYYLTGIGPDNTGANNDFTDPVFVTSTVGCSNPNSIVLSPMGIMFQSDKGIWLLGRDLSTQYIGAPVEAFNDFTVMSAEAIPTTNQVRFVLSNNSTLMFDYFYNQWAEHTNIGAISACLYQGLHTYLNNNGIVYQETPGTYTDGSVPVLLSLTTGWLNVAGVQGYERFYFANLLGTYRSPFKLDVSISYDYNDSAQQSIEVLPEGNFAEPWGGEAVWGSGGPWGGCEGDVFSARVFPEKQKCQSFEITLQEVYDASMGQSAGQGLTLSGLALIVGVKRGFRTQRAARSFG